MRNYRKAAVLAAFAALSCAAAYAQFQSPQRSASKPTAVEYLFPEQIVLPPGKATSVALHFRVAAGLHINSHTPREAELIPTTLVVPEASGVRMELADYPPGADFALPADPKLKLSVYTGEFVIHARLVAPAGDRLVEAKLRYQACDNTQCMPPKTITVAIDVVGR